MKKMKKGTFRSIEDIPDDMNVNFIINKSGYGKLIHELIKEKRELSSKIMRAKNWLYSDHSKDKTVDSMTLFLLDAQIKIMMSYMEILEARIHYIKTNNKGQYE